jgi:hypothetical protein
LPKETNVLLSHSSFFLVCIFSHPFLIELALVSLFRLSRFSSFHLYSYPEGRAFTTGRTLFTPVSCHAINEQKEGGSNSVVGKMHPSDKLFSLQDTIGISFCAIKKLEL